MKRRAVMQCAGAAAVAQWLPASARADARAVSIGVTPGPHAEIIEVVRRIAERRGLTMRVEVRDAGRGINADVASGGLDIACFQDAVDFAAEMQRRHGTLVNVAPTVTRPIAIYSRRLAALRDLKVGATIGLPREAAAAARALILLHNHGLLTLRDGAGLQATPKDVVTNRRRLQLVGLASERLAGALDRLDCAVIDSPHAARAGLLPARDSIGMEDARTPYTDILAVRHADRGQAWVATLIESYHSEEVKHFLLERFQESVRRPW